MLRMPPVTLALILANVAVYLLEIATGGRILGPFALWPLHSGLFHPWQLVTYGFLHDPNTFAHIFFNMFALFMFGRSLELYWGGTRFLIFFLVCVLTAGLTQLAVTAGTSAPEPTLGASGGVFGVLLAFAWLFPRQKLFVIPIPIPIPAWLFVTLYAIAELFFGVTGRWQGVAHFAHLGGMLGGALCILAFGGRRYAGARR
ncbi:MAG TPA: rhomboid family intramembrane serine protease [Steroidobacteraceae bacterium]|jgi:membrane associated rhomboid family serine protease|nr:rhomboid family intramembrane serine protease [Steroidobacteraceae bacterium]